MLQYLCNFFLNWYENLNRMPFGALTVLAAGYKGQQAYTNVLLQELNDFIFIYLAWKARAIVNVNVKSEFI